MKAWWSAPELEGLPGIPKTLSGIIRVAKREGWHFRKRAGRGGGREYAFEALPAETRAELARRHVSALAPSRGQPHSNAGSSPNSSRAAAPLAGLTGRKLSRAQARLTVLATLRTFQATARVGIHQAENLFAADYNAGRIEIDAEVRAALPQISAPSLQRWRALAAREGAARLAGAYQGRRFTGKIDGNPVLRDAIVTIVTGQPHLGAAQILFQLGARFGESLLPSKRRLQAWLERFREENKVFLAHATDPDRAKGRFSPAMGSASETIVRANQLWEIDDTRADVAAKDGRRFLIALVDVATRRSMVLISETASTGAVLALVRCAILAWGKPQAIKSDNGKNYTSKHMEAALEALGIRHLVCDYFSPEQKPHVERFIGTIEHDLFEQLPGYVGHDVAERQGIRARSAFAQRMGKPVEELFRVELTTEQLQVAADAWCSGVYAHREHGGLAGRTPAEIAAEQAHLALGIDERELDVMLAEPAGGGWRTVAKKGIALDGTHFIHAELAAIVGHHVQVKWDQTDAGRVVVYGAEGNFICVAEAPERTGISRKAVAAHGRALYRKTLAAGRSELQRLARNFNGDRLVFEALAKASARNGGSVGPETIEAIAQASAAESVREAAQALGTPTSRWQPRVISDAPDPVDAPAPSPRHSQGRDGADDVVDLTGAPRPHPAAADSVWVQWIHQNLDRATEADRALYDEELQSEHARFVLEWTLRRLAERRAHDLELAAEEDAARRKTAAG